MGITLVVIMVLGMLPVSFEKVQAEELILIGSSQEMKKIGVDENYPLTGNYRLTADISMDVMISGTFAGSFDGYGHTIDLSISNDSWNTALFEKLTGTVENLITTGTVTGTRGNTGAIAAEGTGTVRKCWNQATISSAGEGVSGIVGFTGSAIEDCLNTGEISNSASRSRVGGITCSNLAAPGSVVRCFSTHCSDINLAFYLVGGDSDVMTITDCYYAGSVNKAGYRTSRGTTGGTRLSGDQITSTDAYVGWDFTKTWIMTEAGPRLRMPVEAPTFTPGEGEFDSVQTVELSTVTADAAIYYTTNGDAPTAGSTLYSGSIEVDETSTIKAVAVRDGVSSEIASATFTINVPAAVVQAPSARTLSYTGSEQELVTAGTAEYGTMSYALGTDADAAPADGWAESVPQALTAGEYYVWYRAVNAYASSTPASVRVSIEKADPVAEVPDGLTAEYGQTLAEVSMEGKNPGTNTPGTWAWADDSVEVGNVGINSFKAAFTPSDTENYDSVSDVDVNVTVGSRPEYIPASEDTNSVTAQVEVSENGVSVKSVDEDDLDKIAESDDKNLTMNLTSLPDSNHFEFSPDAGDQIYKKLGEDGHVTTFVREESAGGSAWYGFDMSAGLIKDGARLTADTLSVDSPLLTDEQKQTISGLGKPENIRVYDLNLMIGGNQVHDPGSTISFWPSIPLSWEKEESAGSDRDSAAFNLGNTIAFHIDDRGNAEQQEIKLSGGVSKEVRLELLGDVTQMEVSPYSMPRLDLVHFSIYVLVHKEDSAVSKAPAAKSLTYSGIASELVSAGTATGGEMRYALGSDAVTAPEAVAYSADIPTAVDAGTYYVWYMAAGDEIHADTIPACVEVTIAAKALTITAEDENKVYDGEELISEAFSSVGLAEGDAVESLVFTGLQTGAGSSDNVPSGAVIRNAEGRDVTENYSITYANGTLTVTQAPNKVTVEMNGWTCGEEANVPKTSALFGTPIITYASSPDGTYTKTVPSAVGTWYVKATVEESADYAGAEAIAEFTISEPVPNPSPVYYVKKVTGASGTDSFLWENGKDLVITVGLDAQEDESYDHFTALREESRTFVRDDEYTAHQGSTVITIREATLKTLADGEHTFTIEFDDGSVDVKVNIKKDLFPAAHTGNAPLVGGWILLVIGSAATLMLTGRRRTGIRR